MRNTRSMEQCCIALLAHEKKKLLEISERKGLIIMHYLFIY